MEDLWCFNEETLVREVAASEIPVISAIGHEIDFTLCDFAADRREPTPSAAAEVVIGAHADLAHRVNNLSRRLESSVFQRYQNSRLRLTRASGSLQAVVGRRINDAQRRLERCKHSYPMQHPETMLLPYKQRIDLASEAMSDAMDRRMTENTHRLAMAREHLCILSPEKHVEQLKVKLQEKMHRLQVAARRQTERKKEGLNRIKSQLRALDPTSVLSRGYSIIMTADGKQAIRNFDCVKPGDAVSALLHQGRLDMEVKAAVAPEDHLNAD